MSITLNRTFPVENSNNAIRFLAVNTIRQNVKSYLDFLFSDDRLNRKDNAHSKWLRNDANDWFSRRKYQLCCEKYSDSLRHATYNGEEYAIALANRSAAFFGLGDFKDCIKDIDLCLRAAYPNKLRPKVYLRKAKCYQKLGNAAEMRKVLVDALNFLDDFSSDLGTEQEANYRMQIKDLIVMKSNPQLAEDEFYDELSNIEYNETFHGASNAVAIKYNKLSGHYAVAKKEIERGDVLFVEKAYAFAPCPTVVNTHDIWSCGLPCIVNIKEKISCQFCLAYLKSCVPCKSCVKWLYCDEICRDAAWEQFHRWECEAVQANFFRFNNYAYLALRIILKAAFAGHLEVPNLNLSESSGFGNAENNYPYVYGLPTYIERFKKEMLMEYVAIAALTVRYLQTKTDFLQHVKELQFFREKTEIELNNTIGGLLLRHSVQLHHSAVAVRMISRSCRPTTFAVAVAMCPSVAVLTRSCTPNTSNYFIGDKLVIKATQKIQQGDKISRCHTLIKESALDVYFTSLDIECRKELIKEFCFINCRCNLCSDLKKNMEMLNAYLCDRCKGPLVGNKCRPHCNTLFVCMNCKANRVFSVFESLKDQCIVNKLYMFMATQNITVAQECLDLCKSTYVSWHPVFAQLYHSMFEYYNATKNAYQSMRTAKELKELIKVRRQADFHINLGIAMYKICNLNLQVIKDSSSVQTFSRRRTMKIIKDFINEAKEIFKFYHPQFIAQLEKLE